MRVGGVDVGGLTTARRGAGWAASIARPAAPADHRPPRRRDAGRWAAREAQIGADRRRDRRRGARRAAARATSSRATVRDAHRRRRRRQTSSRRSTYSRRGGRAARRPHRAHAVRTRPADASVDILRAGVSEVEGQDGRALDAAALHRRHPRGDRLARRRAARSRATRGRSKPKVPRRRARRAYPDVLIVERDSFKLHALQGPQAGQDLRRSPSARQGLETPAGLYHIQNKASTRPGTCPTRLGGQARRQGHPGRRAGQPDQGALDGHLRRRRHPRHRRTTARSARAASHGCVRMRIPDVEELYDQVPVGARRSTSPEPVVLGQGAGAPHADLARIGHLLPAALQEQRRGGRQWRSTSVPMKTPRSRLRRTAYHMVEASPVPWIRSHGRGGGSPAGERCPPSMSWRCVAT